MSETIQAKYDELNEIARRFADKAQAIEDMRRKVQASHDDLTNDGWRGLGSDAFAKLMQDVVFPATDRLKRALDNGASATQKIAQTVKQAEQEASALFK